MFTWACSIIDYECEINGALNHVEPRIYDSYMGLKQSILSMFWDLGVQNVALLAL
jgi:hypothetical protein